MFRYQNKPRRSKAGFPAGPAPHEQKSDQVYRVFFSLVMLAFAARILVGCIGALGGWQPVAQVGDRLIFTPATSGARRSMLQIPARLVTSPWSRPGPACTLQIAAMVRPGGAMTVLAVRQDGVMLSWAGGATASAGKPCQGGQSLLVADAAYQQLLTTQAPPRPGSK